MTPGEGYLYKKSVRPELVVFLDEHYPGLLEALLELARKLAGEEPAAGAATRDWNTAEADIVAIGAADTRYKLHSLVLDISALAGTVTIRLYMEVDGVERQVYSETFTVAADGPGLWIVHGTIGIHEVLRVTAESDDPLDDGQPIGYDYMLEEM